MKPVEWEARWHLLVLNTPRKVTSVLSPHPVPVLPAHLPFTALGGLCHEIFHFLSLFLSPSGYREMSLAVPRAFKPSKQ